MIFVELGERDNPYLANTVTMTPLRSLSRMSTSSTIENNVVCLCVRRGIGKENLKILK
jgi:hypothetical protein